jgi:TetR/AcrR family transcriptional regulator, regulator of biofilm formation and stress response
MTTEPVRRYDPRRRDRIIDACLDVIAEVGVAGTSHRKVAEAADVPLGSMTYHFTGMAELLHEAFTRFAVAFSDRIGERMAGAADRQAAIATIIDAVEADILSDQRELVLTQELYTLAARDATFRDITNAWMARSRAALERHFDPTTAWVLDALIEGLTLHRALDNEPQHDGVVRTAVGRITDTRITDTPVAGETP